MVTVEQLIEYHTITCDEARELISVKGHDYSGQSQRNGGDTLSNLRLPKLLGVTNTNTQTILTRLVEKYSRLISLTLDPNTEAQVKDEKVSDTINDCINFLVYLKYMYEEERQHVSFDDGLSIYNIKENEIDLDLL